MKNKIMNNTKNSSDIYENKDVFGSQVQCDDFPTRWSKVSKIMSSLKHPPKNVLDIGCGDGFISKKIQDIYPEASIYGIDISRNAIEVAKEKYPLINFKEVDAEKYLPFESNYFDLVFSGEHIEHLKDTDTYLEEINRVMKDGGILIITTPNLGFWVSRILLLIGIQPFACEASLRRKFPLFRLFGKDFPENSNVPPVGHLRIFTLSNLKMLLEYYAFKTIEVTGASLFNKPGWKQLDKLFSFSPTLAFGLILKVKKVNGGVWLNRSKS